MKDRNRRLWIGAILGMALLLPFLPAGCSSRLKMNLTHLLSPLLDASTSLRQNVLRLRKAITSQRQLVAQSENLQAEVVRLQHQLQHLREVERENARLHELLQFKNRSPFTLKPARVINRAASNWWIALDVDAGTDDGVSRNRPVITPAGLVGKTTDVGRRVARVLLVADPNCKVAAMIESSRHSGIVEGETQGSMELPRCLMRFIHRNAEVQLGDRVITSGLDELYPKGILIGRVIQVSEEASGLYKSARVEPSADLARLEEVFIVMNP